MPGPPSSSTAERLANQFYEWEQRGRGWSVWPAPVELEPPFRPFLGHFVASQSLPDEGRKPTGITSLVDRFRRFLDPWTTPSESIDVESDASDEDEPEPDEARATGPLAELELSLPPDADPILEVFEDFLLALGRSTGTLAFEIVGSSEAVTTQIAAAQIEAPGVKRQLLAHFPDAAVVPARRSLATLWEGTDCVEIALAEFGLSRECMLPLRAQKRLPIDPLVGIVAALEDVRPGELGVFQVLFQPARHPWNESMIRAVTGSDGGSFFADAPELLSCAKDKTARPLFAAIIRIAAKSGDPDRPWEIARNLAGALGVFANPQGNELIPLNNDDYPFDAHIEDVLLRQTHRSGMLLNVEELAGFVHLPSGEVASAKLARRRGRTKRSPSLVQNPQGVLVGHNLHAEETKPIVLTAEQRVRHMHVIGASGTGKSTFLLNLITQDIRNGGGVGVLDPHGDLIDRILELIPDNRINDVVLLDPSDEEYSIGFNILSAHSDLEKRLLASDLVSVFQRLSTSWGDQMGSVLQNAILAFLESNRGGTLVDLRRFLLETKFRNEFLATVSDPEIVYYWQHAFAQLSGNKSIGPVLTRLETFLSPKPIRYMVTQTQNRLDFGTILDRGKIFLAKLSQGLIGRENSYLLGSLLVAKLQQLVMGRQRQAASARRDFWLYLDEFHNFITPSMAEILTGARKYRLGLVLAHQELRQLQRDSEVASAVLANPYVRVCFRVGDDDAKKLADGFASFEARDLQNLGTGEAICRVERSDFDFNLSVPLPKPVLAGEADARCRQIIEASRKSYGTPRLQLEAEIRKSGSQPDTAASPPEAKRRSTKSETLHKPDTEHLAKPTATKRDDEEIASDTKPERDAPAEASEHQGLKHSIQCEAEKLGYSVVAEEYVLGGQQRVDLSIHHGDLRIACEISVRNAIKYEVANVKKCLEAGFGHIAVVCVDARKIENIRKALAECVSPAESSKISVYLPNTFLDQLRAWAATARVADSDATPKKRRIEFGSPLSETERRAHEREMLASLTSAMKHTKVVPS